MDLAVLVEALYESTVDPPMVDAGLGGTQGHAESPKEFATRAAGVLCPILYGEDDAFVGFLLTKYGTHLLLFVVPQDKTMERVVCEMYEKNKNRIFEAFVRGKMPRHTYLCLLSLLANISMWNKDYPPFTFTASEELFLVLVGEAVACGKADCDFIPFIICACAMYRSNADHLHLILDIMEQFSIVIVSFDDDSAVRMLYVITAVAMHAGETRRLSTQQATVLLGPVLMLLSEPLGPTPVVDAALRATYDIVCACDRLSDDLAARLTATVSGVIAPLSRRGCAAKKSCESAGVITLYSFRASPDMPLKADWFLPVLEFFKAYGADIPGSTEFVLYLSEHILRSETRSEELFSLACEIMLGRMVGGWYKCTGVCAGDQSKCFPRVLLACAVHILEEICVQPSCITAYTEVMSSELADPIAQATLSDALVSHLHKHRAGRLDETGQCQVSAEHLSVAIGARVNSAAEEMFYLARSGE